MILTGKSGKPRDKPPKLMGATQFQRFVETAKAFEVDESGQAFERAISVVITSKAAKKPIELLTVAGTPTIVEAKEPRAKK